MKNVLLSLIQNIEKFITFDSVPYGDEFNGGIYLKPRLVKEINEAYPIFFSFYELKRTMERCGMLSALDDLSRTQYRSISYRLKTQVTQIYEYHPC